MHTLVPVVDHYEDIKIEAHYKIWLSVSRVQSEYLRILRLDKEKKATQSFWINKMKAQDAEISQAYFDNLKAETKDEELDRLYIENERTAVDIANKALKVLAQKLNNALDSGQEVTSKECVVILKTIEVYANIGKNKQTSKGTATTNLARQLLEGNNTTSNNDKEFQRDIQEATKLRLPTTSL